MSQGKEKENSSRQTLSKAQEATENGLMKQALKTALSPSSLTNGMMTTVQSCTNAASQLALSEEKAAAVLVTGITKAAELDMVNLLSVVNERITNSQLLVLAGRGGEQTNTIKITYED